MIHCQQGLFVAIFYDPVRRPNALDKCLPRGFRCTTAGGNSSMIGIAPGWRRHWQCNPTPVSQRRQSLCVWRDSTPHSKDSIFFFEYLLGPTKWVTTMVVPTKPKAAKNWMAIGKKSEGMLVALKTMPLSNYRGKFTAYYWLLANILEPFLSNRACS